MPRLVTSAPHLSVAELAPRDRHAHDPVARRHWHLRWLVAARHRVPEVAQLVGDPAHGVRAIIRRANAAGPAGLADRRQPSSGHPPLLAPALRIELAQARAGPAPDGGLHPGGLQAQVDALRAAPPAARLTVWARRGQRPTAWVRRRSPWRAGSAFIRPTTGQSWWALVPTVTTEAMNLVLATFAADDGIDASHRAVVVLDGAGWHPAKRLVVPDGIELVFRPPASPELQPVERVWSRGDEPVANRTFADRDALTDVLVTRCQTVRADRRRIKAQTDDHWWAVARRPWTHQ